MIPKFPESKRLEIADRDFVGQFTARHAPFSEFHFSNLWAWDIDGSIRLSQLHDNLVVQLTDGNGAPFLSFLGCTAVNRTAEMLIRESKLRGFGTVLRCVPACSVSGLDNELFCVTASPDHYDYVLNANQVSAYDGAVFAPKRNDARKFAHRYPEAVSAIIDLNCPRVLRDVHALFARWGSQREKFSDGMGHDREARAFVRYLDNRSSDNRLDVGLFFQDSLIAFSLSEIINDEYAITIFEKTDTLQFSGIGAHLNQQVARLLSARGVRFINIEEDLGIAGLRKNKQSYAPDQMLQKFDVALVAPDFCTELVPGHRTMVGSELMSKDLSIFVAAW